MIALLFATEMEATPLVLQLADAAPLDPTPNRPTMYTSASLDIAVAIVGMGKRAAEAGTLRVIERLCPTGIFNIGIAGGLSDSAVVGKIYRVRQVVDWPHAANTPIRLAADRFEELPARDLVSSDEPVFDDGLRKTLAGFGEMVDMEGSAIAAVAGRAGIQCTSIKAISDQAKHGHKETLRKNLRQASEKLSRLVAQNLFPG